MSILNIFLKLRSITPGIVLKMPLCSAEDSCEYPYVLKKPEIFLRVLLLHLIFKMATTLENTIFDDGEVCTFFSDIFRTFFSTLDNKKN